VIVLTAKEDRLCARTKNRYNPRFKGEKSQTRKKRKKP